MPRQARKKSGSGIYHIMLRGINRQIIFEDEEDSEVFLETMGLYKAEFNCLIYGYCLMKNHAHLLVKIDNDEIHNFMRKLGAKYVYWYNWKYDRVGGLFQDRYKSEPVEDDGYFLTVLRYIHQNPVKAGLCESVAEYEESSYNEYINLKSGQLTDADFALSIIGKTQFIEFNNQQNDDKCLEVDENSFRLTDEEAKKIIFNVSNCKNTAEFQRLELKQRDQFIKELKEEGLSFRQISRLTGLSFGLVRKL